MSMEKPKTHLQWFTQIQSNGTIKDPPCVFKACYDRDSLYPFTMNQELFTASYFQVITQNTCQSSILRIKPILACYI